MGLTVRISMGFEDHYTNIPGVHQQGVAAATTGLSAAQKEDSGADLASFMTHIRREAYELIKIAAMHSASMQDCKTVYLQNPPQYTLGRGGIFDIANLHMIMLQNLFYGAILSLSKSWPGTTPQCYSGLKTNPM